MSNSSNDWEHVATRPCDTFGQLLGSSSSVYEFENKRTGERRTVTAYNYEEAGRKIADGEFSD